MSDNSMHLLDGIICTPDEYAISKSGSLTNTTIHCLTRGESIGLTVVAQAGLLSLAAITYVYSIIIRNVIWRIRNGTSGKSRIFQKPMDLLMFSLFSSDVLQAIGAVMDIKWIHDGKVHTGEFCIAQGIVQQLGETGVAIATLSIALYTFIGVWTGKIISMRLTVVVVAVTWLFIIMMVILGNTLTRGTGRSPYEAPTPYWCWISQDYLQLRIAGEYFWLWLALLCSIMTYVPLYLWSRGNIRLDKQHWWKFHWQKADADPDLKCTRRLSFRMLSYPLVYSISILPFSVVRWIGFVQARHGGVNRISSVSTMAVTALYGLSGAANVVLLLSTRPNSGLFARDLKLGSTSPDNESRNNEVAPDHEEVELLGRLPSR